MSEKVAEVLWLIRTMTASELIELRDTLGGEFGDFGPDSGVREPRNPKPSTGSSAIVLDPETETT